MMSKLSPGFAVRFPPLKKHDLLIPLGPENDSEVDSSEYASASATTPSPPYRNVTLSPVRAVLKSTVRFSCFLRHRGCRQYYISGS